MYKMQPIVYSLKFDTIAIYINQVHLRKVINSHTFALFSASFKKNNLNIEKNSDVGKMLPSRLIHYREIMSERKGQSMQQI